MNRRVARGKEMAKRSKGTVGVVGLGNMGGAFARHLAAARSQVIDFDIAAARKRAPARAGDEIAAVETLAAVAPVIVLSLPNPQALDATIAAITRHELPVRIVVEASTFTLDDKQRAETALRKAGHVMLDCPVSGTGAQAAAKDIVIYASGDAKAIAKTARMFSDFSRATYNVGVFGNGSRMKYVANLLVTIHNVASAEAMVLGIKSGLDPQMVYDLIRTGAGTSRVFELRGPMMVQNNYDAATMKNKVWQKDMDVIGAYATSLGVPTPLFSATIPVYASAMSMGHGLQDTASVCGVLQTMAEVKRGKPGKRSKRR